VLDKRPIYQSRWVGLEHWSVQLPDGSLIPDHHVVVYPRPAVGIVARDDAGRFLLIDHYRFITNTRGWEIPAGGVDEGETILGDAARELLEETGHTAAGWQLLGWYHPSNGSSNQVFHLVSATDLQQIASVTDTNESIACQWFTAAEALGMLQRNEVQDGFSLTGLAWALLL
jgi:ADP-ribose pyrophosphatase